MLILAIDTSCDDTSAAIVRDTTVLSNIISSQDEVHSQWGGVVPSLAKRAHKERIDEVISLALRRARMEQEDIDVVAVTYGPGLAIALEVGVEKAKELAKALGKPLVAVNHMEGHIYANFAARKGAAPPTFPVLVLLVSGGHTELVRMDNHGIYTLLGETLDDAVGEAYDKVARMLGLGYPGGALLARLAEDGDALAYTLPLPMVGRKDVMFSFSGLKTAVYRLVKEVTHDGGEPLTKTAIQNIAASFQHVAIEHLVRKTIAAAEKEQISAVLLGGGVAANAVLRKELRKNLRLHFKGNAKLHYPKTKKLCSDNAAMIGIAGYFRVQNGEVVEDIERLDRDPVLGITDR